MFDDQRMILSLELLSSNDNCSARISTCLFLILPGPECLIQWKAVTNCLFSQWAWTRCCNITAGRFLPQTLAWRYNNNDSTKIPPVPCSDLPGPGWLTGTDGHSLAVIFPVGMVKTLQHYRGPLLAADIGLALQQ
jgi:hypothetical protein